jgi:hypothetical protein
MAKASCAGGGRNRPRTIRMGGGMELGLGEEVGGRSEEDDERSRE